MQKNSKCLGSPYPKCYDLNMDERLKINLFEYLDYRKFLRDYYAAQKQSRAGFSLRRFSEKGGFTSSNFLKLVMDGDRNLTEKSLIKFADALNLNKQEREFFTNLVHYNQADSHDNKNLFYKKLIQFKNFSSVKPMEREQYEYYSSWYHAVVRELITSSHFHGEPQKLIAKIYPSISLKELEKSIELLEKLGFIKKNDHGHWGMAQTVITTGSEPKALVLTNYHKDFLALARTQIEKVPSQQRDISTLTLGVERSMIPELKKRIQNFRSEILKLVSTQTNADEVVVLAMQLLPVTKSWGDES